FVTVYLVQISSKSNRQDYDRQISDLKAIAKKNNWTVVKIVTAKISATKIRLSARQDIAELYDLVEAKAIEKVLVTELSRLGRMAKEIREVYEFLQESGISIFIQSLGLDTGSKGAFQKSINNIIITILSEITELETVRLSERIKSGMKEARRKGIAIGRPKGSTSDMTLLIQLNPKYKTAAKALREGLSLRKTAAFAGISVNTVRKIKLEIEQSK
ncbi:MAG: recombinase family protein, partial [Aureispira sp.]